MLLCHRPEATHITLDEHGWADVEELLAGINGTGIKTDRKMLERIVAADRKQAEGLKPMSRRYVHLSKEIRTSILYSVISINDIRERNLVLLLILIHLRVSIADIFRQGNGRMGRHKRGGETEAFGMSAAFIAQQCLSQRF